LDKRQGVANGIIRKKKKKIEKPKAIATTCPYGLPHCKELPLLTVALINRHETEVQKVKRKKTNKKKKKLERSFLKCVI